MAAFPHKLPQAVFEAEKQPLAFSTDRTKKLPVDRFLPDLRLDQRRLQVFGAGSDRRTGLSVVVNSGWIRIQNVQNQMMAAKEGGFTKRGSG